MMHDGKHYVVTGGAGFIGMTLVRRLLEAGASVTVVDDLRSSIIPAAELRLLEMEFGDRFIWHGESVGEWWYALHYSEEADAQLTPLPDGIFHLASPVGPAGVLKKGGHIVDEIVTDTGCCADLAAQWKTRLVFVSTSEVYGGGQSGLCREDMPCIVQHTPSARLEYAMGKLAAEVALQNQHANDGLDVVIIRPFNVAGPGQNKEGGFVVPRFVEAAMQGQPLTVFGDGRAVRAFTHVEDIVDGLLLALLKGRAGEVYNLGNSANVLSIGRLAQLVLSLVHTTSTLTYTDGKTLFGERYAEANDKFPDASKADQELGWRPSRTVETIIADTYAWLKRAGEVLNAL